MRAIVVRKHGGPEELKLDEWDTPVPGPGEVLIDVAAAGVNFHDIDERIGLFPRELPYVPGFECSGTVSAVGPDVTRVAVGDLVATLVLSSPGAYAEKVVVPAESVVPVPAEVGAEQAAALLLQGMTAHYLTRDSYQVRPGETALVHAAAGGLGQLLTQVLRREGVRVIGTVSTADKEQAARVAGADEVIRYTEVDFADEVRKLTDGKGVDVIYDGVGQATFDKGLASLRTRGTLILYGQTSGVVPPMDMRAGKPGSFHLIFPMIPDFIATNDEMMGRATDIFDWVRAGDITVHVGRTYPLADAGTAHDDLEHRRSTGKLLLIP
ncbi:quinone oxidoreductase family protein [Micromonospora sp. LOL_015]|uniref:quinone oxidoreductase family protein n=1 Tax=Micromonospora sp. LOL_015 TaxID=3345416 RepID=UPI003A8AE09D